MDYKQLMTLARDAGLGPENVSGLLQARLEIFGRAVEKAERNRWRTLLETRADEYERIAEETDDGRYDGMAQALRIASEAGPRG